MSPLMSPGGTTTRDGDAKIAIFLRYHASIAMNGLSQSSPPIGAAFPADFQQVQAN